MYLQRIKILHRALKLCPHVKRLQLTTPRRMDGTCTLSGKTQEASDDDVLMASKLDSASVGSVLFPILLLLLLPLPACIEVKSASASSSSLEHEVDAGLEAGTTQTSTTCVLKRK